MSEHPMARLSASERAEHVPKVRDRALHVLSTALPPAASATPYSGQECIGLEVQWRALYRVLHGTMSAREGNSCLLVGGGGSGKSLLVHSVLRRLRQELGGSNPYYVVTLSGLLQSSDRLALRELAKQLMEQGGLGGQALDDMPGLEGDVPMGDEAQNEAAPPVEAHWIGNTEMGAGGSDDEDDEDDMPLAQRMLAREAVLAGEGELEDEPPSHTEREAHTSSVLSSMATTLTHILDMLSSADAETERPLVIVLDQFDLFAKRARQSLLYCLLDAVQARSYAPGLALVGLTSLVDAGDFLEKRVKSRFSQRMIHLYPLSFEGYREVARTALLGGVDAFTAADPVTAAWRQEVNVRTTARLALLTYQGLLQQPAFQKMLQGLYELSGDIRLLYQVLAIPMAWITPESPELHASAFVEASAGQQQDTTAQLLLELTEPEMAVLITARHLHLRDKELFTFEMCFHELVHFVRRVQSDLTAAVSEKGTPRALVALAGLETLASRTLIRQAFFHLLSLEVFLPEPARLSLTLPSNVASRTGAVTSAYGTFPSATVVPEFLPVRSCVSGKAVLDSARDPARPEPLNSILLKWAESAG